MSLRLIDAGGTITSIPGPSGALLGNRHEDRLRPHLPSQFRALDIQTVYSGLSEEMSFKDMALVTKAIVDAEADPAISGIVVAHGTDVMEETAYLSDLFHSGQKPVIFTGAQRAPGAPDYDGLYNLTDALAVAQRSQAAQLGTLIVFGGRLIPAWQANKCDTIDLKGFTARDGQFGVLERDSHIRFPDLAPRPAPLTWREPSERVTPLLLGAGSSGAMIRAAQYTDYDAIVLSALGSGNASPDVVDAVREVSDKDVLVAVASRCTAGRAVSTYDSAARLVEAGAIMTHGLPASQTRILLSLLLAQVGITRLADTFTDALWRYR